MVVLPQWRRGACLQQIIHGAHPAFRLIGRQRLIAVRIPNGALRKPLVGSIPGIRGAAGFDLGWRLPAETALSAA